MGLGEGLVTEEREDMKTGQGVDDNMKTGVNKMAIGLTTTIITTVIEHSDTTTTTITTMTEIMSHLQTGVDLKGNIMMTTTTNSEEGIITVTIMATTTKIVTIAKIGSLAITIKKPIMIAVVIRDNTNNKESNQTHQRAYSYRISQRYLFLDQILASRRLG